MRRASYEAEECKGFFPYRRTGHRHHHLDAQAHPIKLRTGRNISKATQFGRLTAEAAYQRLELTRDIRS